MVRSVKDIRSCGRQHRRRGKTLPKTRAEHARLNTMKMHSLIHVYSKAHQKSAEISITFPDAVWARDVTLTPASKLYC